MRVLLLASLLLVLADGTARAQSESPLKSATASPVVRTSQTSNAPTNLARAISSDRERIADYLAQCLKDWDSATHMTKKEWAVVCRRVVDSRAKFRLEKGLGIPKGL
jgi:hypothetical protein